jgi:serine/alanine adding enzyme
MIGNNMDTDVAVQIYNEEGKLWDDFVSSMNESTNYHRFGWREVLEKSFGHQTYYLVARNCGKEICGILPLVHLKSRLFGNFLVSLPFFNYCGPLCSSTQVSTRLLNYTRNVMEEVCADYVELRYVNDWKEGFETKSHKVTMVLDLETDQCAQWKVFDAKVRNQVRKAEKSGLTAIVGHLELLDGFYEVFCRNMRDLGTPVYGKNFFQNILEVFPDSTRIISVVLEGKVIASCVLTWFKGTLEVPWASSVIDYREKCPNNLLYWEAIRFAIRNGVRQFDFGRSTPGEGTFRFKKQWGAKPVPLYWQYMIEPGRDLPEINPKNPRYQAAIKVWKKLPVSLTRILGPRIVRNIP